MKKLKLYEGCLIIVDMIKGFTDIGVLHDKNIKRVIPRQIELIKESKAKGYAIIFVNDAHTKDSVEFIRFGNTFHGLKNTEENELAEELKEYQNQEDTFVFEKNSTSFMESPEFRKFITEQENLKEFEGVGCCTDICINNGFIGLANYLDQINRIHNIIVHEDAIATYNEDNRKEYVEAAKLLMKQQGIQLVKKK